MFSESLQSLYLWLIIKGSFINDIQTEMPYKQKCHGHNPKSVAEHALSCHCHCEVGWIGPEVLLGLENQEYNMDACGEKLYRVQSTDHNFITKLLVAISSTVKCSLSRATLVSFLNVT